MVKYFVIKDFRGTCSLVEMLKGYIVKERLGTPDIDSGVHLGVCLTAITALLCLGYSILLIKYQTLPLLVSNEGGFEQATAFPF